jgi:hypothetical protein
MTLTIPGKTFSSICWPESIILGTHHPLIAVDGTYLFESIEAV